MRKRKMRKTESETRAGWVKTLCLSETTRRRRTRGRNLSVAMEEVKWHGLA